MLKGGGGREAAAKMLGDKGLGIKISEDGEVTMYGKWGSSEEISKIKIFV